jgi:hypothetical protein
MPPKTAFARWRRVAVAAGAAGAVAGLPAGPALASPLLTGAGPASAGLVPVPVTEALPVFGIPAAVWPPADTHGPQGTGLYTVACPGARACTAGGNYEQKSGSVQAMAVSRVHGQWRPAVRLVLPPDAAAQPYAQVTGMACVTEGNCVAAGGYTATPSRGPSAFLAVQAHGRWSTAVPPRLPANAAARPSARLSAVACTRTGFCEAVGSYTDRTGRRQAMAVTMVAGRWQAVEITAPPGTATDPQAVLTGIACTGAGTCVAVGSYAIRPGAASAMGAAQVRGTWGRAVAIAAPPGARSSPYTAITSVSCTSGGLCVGVGRFAVTDASDRAMSVTETGGRFGKATAIAAVPPGAATTASTALTSVACPARGQCVAVGVGTNASGHTVALHMVQSGSGWVASFLASPPGASPGRHQQSSLFSVSCARPQRCTAVGYYNDDAGGYGAEAVTGW